MASKRRQKRQGCGGKKRFNTQAEAVAHVKYLRAKNVIKPNERTNCYKCKFCPFFHWGHGRFNG